MAAANVMAANINVTVKNASGPVSVATTGTNTVTVTVTNKGSVTNPSGPAITVTAQQGAITVTDNGAVSASGDGIYATNTSADGVSITVNQSLQAAGIAGVSAFDNGAGAAGVTIGSGGKGNPLTIASPQIVDAVAISGSGPASVTAGANDSFTAGAPGAFQAANLAAVGLVTSSNPGGGGPALSITVGANDSFTLQGDKSAAVAAQIGLAGPWPERLGERGHHHRQRRGRSMCPATAPPGSSASWRTPPARSPTAGSGTSASPSARAQIIVDEVGADGLLSGAETNSGIAALSGGGNVLIDDAAQVIVTGGVDASVGLNWRSPPGPGPATINSRALVTLGQRRRDQGADHQRREHRQCARRPDPGGERRRNRRGRQRRGGLTVTTQAGTDVKTLSPAAFSGIFASSVTGAVTIPPRARSATAASTPERRRAAVVVETDGGGDQHRRQRHPGEQLVGPGDVVVEAASITAAATVSSASPSAPAR